MCSAKQPLEGLNTVEGVPWGQPVTSARPLRWVALKTWKGSSENCRNHQRREIGREPIRKDRGLGVGNALGRGSFLSWEPA